MKIEHRPQVVHCPSLPLRFRFRRHPVEGVLEGSPLYWSFHSDSPAFLRTVPSGTLTNYALWTGGPPEHISELYNAILEAAMKAGYCMEEASGE